jgi:regulator of sigma E protease
MEPGEEEDPRGFNKKSVFKRMVVISAGSIMNFLLAVVLFIIIFSFIGVPNDSNVVGDVLEGMPAEEAGIKAGDKIISINGKETKNWLELTNAIHEKSGEKINVKIERNEELLSLSLVPVKDKDSGVGLIGIINSTEKYGFLKSIWMGIEKAFGILKLIVVGLVQMIAGEVEAEVAGPVGIVQMIGQVATYGLSSLLSFAAILSVNLGLINLLPIPALDGSRLVFLLIEGIRGKKLDMEKENFVHLIGFILLITLMIIITYQDLVRIFKG